MRGGSYLVWGRFVCAQVPKKASPDGAGPSRWPTMTLLHLFFKPGSSVTVTACSPSAETVMVDLPSIFPFRLVVNTSVRSFTRRALMVLPVPDRIILAVIVCDKWGLLICLK